VHSIPLSPLARMALTSRSLFALPVTKTGVSYVQCRGGEGYALNDLDIVADGVEQGTRLRDQPTFDSNATERKKATPHVNFV